MSSVNKELFEFLKNELDESFKCYEEWKKGPWYRKNSLNVPSSFTNLPSTKLFNNLSAEEIVGTLQEIDNYSPDALPYIMEIIGTFEHDVTDVWNKVFSQDESWSPLVERWMGYTALLDNPPDSD